MSYREPWEIPDKQRPFSPDRDPWESESEEDKGSFLFGAVGAMLGALIGAIPWFLFSAFAQVVVGLLGFFSAWAAVFGYRLLKGRKSFGYAMLVTVVCSLSALVIAEFGAWMYVLCTDPEWQADAQWYGISVAELAFKSLLLRENLRAIMPDLLPGLLIGGLGILSARKNVRQYTDPGMAAQINQQMQAARATLSPLRNFRTTDQELPDKFTVAIGKAARIAGIVCGAICALMLMIMLPLAQGDEEALLVTGILTVVIIVTFSFVFSVANKQIEVDGNKIRVRGGFGRVRELNSNDIASASSSFLNGNVKLYGHNGKVLGTFGSNMKNAPLMMKWLREHNIPLRD